MLAQELPESFRLLARLQAIELSDNRWEYDMAHLIQVLETAGVRRNSPRSLAARLTLLAGFLMVIVVAAVVWRWQASTAGPVALGEGAPGRQRGREPIQANRN